MVSNIPRAVRGLTKDDAPSFGVVPSGSTRQPEASTARYCAYMPPPAIPTVLPTRARAAEDDPAATTVPAPSLPTGSGLSTRAESPRSAPAANDAVTVGRSGVPATVAVDISAPAMRTPKSDGLIGEASTRTNTSLAAGDGTKTSCSESSSVPCDVTNERSSSAVSGKSAVIGVPRFCCGCVFDQMNSQRSHISSPPSARSFPDSDGLTPIVQRLGPADQCDQHGKLAEDARRTPTRGDGDVLGSNPGRGHTHHKVPPARLERGTSRCQPEVARRDGSKWLREATFLG